ncbi:MAG: RNA polymerase subunit sigma-70 [Gemmatimonadaceae bacterium]|nr:RNA polymerase subunit sigma-70 [Gemmatimonadaceae bacterium]
MSTDANASPDWIEQLYDELRVLAHSHLRHERTGHTLSTTALVHEAYLRLSTQLGLANLDRSEFFGAASRTSASGAGGPRARRNRTKRGGGADVLPLDDHTAAFLTDDEADDLLLLDDALTRLRLLDPRGADVVERRFFAGLSLDEVAESLGVSKKTVQRDWIIARAWLRKEIAGEGPMVLEDESR